MINLLTNLLFFIPKSLVYRISCLWSTRVQFSLFPLSALICINMIVIILCLIYILFMFCTFWPLILWDTSFMSKYSRIKCWSNPHILMKVSFFNVSKYIMVIESRSKSSSNRTTFVQSLWLI